MNLRSTQLSKKGRLILISSLFVLFFSAFGLYYIIFNPSWINLNKANNTNDLVAKVAGLSSELDKSESCPGCASRWLDGVLVEAGYENSFPLAIMLDNDPLARPQAALSQALLVYEAPVEGRITRYMAVYTADMMIGKVGPIRSARPYFVNLAADLGAVYLHVGGSPEALELVKQARVYDLNEFYNEKYFWRDYDYPAPHHVFSSQEKWQSYLDNRGLKERQVDAWLFKTESPKELENYNEIEIIFGPAFQAQWQYNRETNDYQRYFNDLKSIDESGEVRAKNIIIQKVASTVLDKVGRLELEIFGNGEAIICLDGSCERGDWKKEKNSRTRYYYESGEELKLNPGVTWIELADDYTKVIY